MPIPLSDIFPKSEAYLIMLVINSLTMSTRGMAVSMLRWISSISNWTLILFLYRKQCRIQAFQCIV